MVRIFLIINGILFSVLLSVTIGHAQISELATEKIVTRDGYEIEIINNVSSSASSSSSSHEAIAETGDASAYSSVRTEITSGDGAVVQQHITSQANDEKAELHETTSESTSSAITETSDDQKDEAQIQSDVAIEEDLESSPQKTQDEENAHETDELNKTNENVLVQKIQKLWKQILEFFGQ